MKDKIKCATDFLLKRGKMIIIITFLFSAGIIYYSLSKDNQDIVIERQEITVEDTNVTDSSKAEDLVSENQAVGEMDLQEQWIYVYVCGYVANPGVVKIKQGSRVFEAVELAGGFTEDADMDIVNLAAFAVDGSRLYIPCKDDTENNFNVAEDYYAGSFLGDAANTVYGNSEAEEPGSQASEKININTADKNKLMTLPGIGESKARDIINYRETQGGFKKIEDIMNISGIKEAAFAKLKDMISV